MNLRKLVEKFINWCRYLKINSKEAGLIEFSIKNWYKAQKYLMYEIANAHPEQRTFVVLKCRQMGATEIISAFDFFVATEMPNMKIALLFDDYKNAWKARQNIAFQYYPTIVHRLKTRMIINSRELIRFDNGSTIQFLYTSNRAENRGRAGRSQAFNYLHASEVAYFKSEEDYYAIQATLAQKHPHRFYIYESTANGLNLFYDLYQTAKKSPVQKAIFIGWWLQDNYILDPNSNAYKAYSYPLDSEEKEWIEYVERVYKFKINMPQVAWWRMQLYERYKGDKDYCLQELPWTEDQAFQLSGNRFFPANLIVKQEERIKEKEKSFKYYYISFDQKFKIERASPQGANLVIFEPPSVFGLYVIGADPTMGANLESDNGVITVYRCYREKLVQVAELADNGLSPQAFARFLLLLACLYNGAMINLEVTGAGHAVLHELDYLRKINWIPEVDKYEDLSQETIRLLQENIRKVREYLYYRPDSLRRSFVRHWKTTPETKAQVFSLFKGYLYQDKIEINSRELLEEMKLIVKNGSVIEGERGEDDRAIATALAIEAYDRYMQKIAPSFEERPKEEELKEYLRFQIGEFTLRLM